VDAPLMIPCIQELEETVTPGRDLVRIADRLDHVIALLTEMRELLRSSPVPQKPSSGKHR